MGIAAPLLGVVSGAGEAGLGGLLSMLLKGKKGQTQQPAPQQPLVNPSFLPPQWAGPPNAPVGDPSLQDAPMQDLAMNPSVSAFMQSLADRKPSPQPRPWWSQDDQ